MGLGLWICRRLVESNGGSVSLSGASGAGTTVTVVLPAAGDPA
jgi:signal transduction histidine kinase